jgi:hypothetical protein
MYSVHGTAVLPAVGFPIRASADQRIFSSSPRLIAAVHALHRLLVPRHPPCALDILTVIIRLPQRTRQRVRFNIRIDRGWWSPVVLEPDMDEAPPRGATTATESCDRSSRVSVIPVCWMTVQFSRSAEKGAGRDSTGRSLKTQQHAAPLVMPADTRTCPVAGAMALSRSGRR